MLSRCLAILLIFLWLASGFCLWYALRPSSLLRIVICNVGQGDAILISYRYSQVLIDAGPDEKVMECLKQYLPHGDFQLETVIATHADHDHIGGMPTVLARYSVSSLIMTDQIKQNADFRHFMDSVLLAKQRGTKIIGSRRGIVISLADGLEIKTLSPEESQSTQSLFQFMDTETQLSAYFASKDEDFDETNDGSIAIILTYHRFIFASMADLEEKGEQTLVGGGLIKDIDVLKAGHHGSKTSTTSPFLAVTRPEFTLISASQDSRYGHPHPEVLRRLEEINSAILRTDQLGSIELQTNGYLYWFFHQS